MSDENPVSNFTYKSPPWLMWYGGGALITTSGYLGTGLDKALLTAGTFLIATAVGVGFLYVSVEGEIDD